MPKTKESSNHPCHFLSLPSAKRFWCRHCMSVFEDAITRWRHSRSCRYGVVNNFMIRRQLEAKALQNTNSSNPVEARLEQSLSPSEEPIKAKEEEDPGPSGEKSNQATFNDLYRCFICQSQFSSLEEMRHHVKYPCNNKKIVTDVPNPAMTVYIDELTDRSRQWDPQPLQEEVVSSEFVPNIVSQETVHSTTVDLKNALQESNITPSQYQENKLTPTNIYVNEQGETVIEVENLDLNSEGGELSLAHLLTQLSQQGIVFDKNKASQMQAQPEGTLSDPASGEIYTTGAVYEEHVDMQNVVKEEDEGQPTAEDAAKTLAQLSVFRGYRANQEAQAEVPTSADAPKEYMVEATTEGYSYVESYAIPSNSAQLHVETTESYPTMRVEYDYSSLPSHQSAGDGSTSQILQSSIIDSASVHSGKLEGVKDPNNMHSISTMPFHHDIQPQIVTYVSSSSSTAQQTHVSEEGGETMMIENVVEGQTIEGPPQQYHHVNISDGMTQEGCHKVSIPSEIETNHNSYIVLNTSDNSTHIVCDPNGNQQEITVGGLNSMPQSILNSVALSNNHHHPQQQQYISASNDITYADNEIKDTEEFEVQTVTLQEIAEHESTGNNNRHEIAVSNLNPNNGDLRTSQLVGDQCVQILHQTGSDDIVVTSEGSFTRAIEHQSSQEGGVSSDASSMPMYVVSTDGSLQLVTSAQAQGVEQTTSQEQNVASYGSQA